MISKQMKCKISITRINRSYDWGKWLIIFLALHQGKCLCSAKLKVIFTILMRQMIFLQSRCYSVAFSDGDMPVHYAMVKNIIKLQYFIYYLKHCIGSVFVLPPVTITTYFLLQLLNEEKNILCYRVRAINSCCNGW